MGVLVIAAVSNYTPSSISRERAKHTRLALLITTVKNVLTQRNINRHHGDQQRCHQIIIAVDPSFTSVVHATYRAER